MKISIFSINGPIIKTINSSSLCILEMVYVGEKKLIGEVINIDKNFATIQVYENTAGLKVGDIVYGTGNQISVTLSPGLLSNIFDGIQQPLKTIKQNYGDFLIPGSNQSFEENKKYYNIIFRVAKNDIVSSGAIFAVCSETDIIEHRFMIPNGISGKIIDIKQDGSYLITENVIVIEDEFKNIHNIPLFQKWPIRKARPFNKRIPISIPLITGQRIIDSLFPIAKGGVAAIPGGFGTGKTMTQHQLAKWSDADIIIYIGCGERGNEITQVLEEFSSLIDPKSGKPMSNRIVLIANTSNMPVASREASIYTGLTIAEYYRDMGYHVAVMADSTSRWAEALREISGRLEEMPAEEGFPAYLPSKISQFYERAGYTLNLNNTEGSVSIIGAVSPQGSDFSEPVTQNTKRFVRAFWTLDKSLAYSRHYPAINWITSYSEYIEDLSEYYIKNIDPNFLSYRQDIYNILIAEDSLMEIVKLIGSDMLPDDQKLIIEVAKVIRLGFLQQNAFHKIDTYVPLSKQVIMMKIILYLYDKLSLIIEQSIPISYILKTNIFEEIIKMKYSMKNDASNKIFESYTCIIDEKIKNIESSNK